MRWTDPAGPLADRPFRLLWLAATTSAVGSAFVPVALAFAILDSGGNATSLGLVLLAGSLAGLMWFVVGGVWADRLPRRSLMLAADLVRLVTEAGVAALLLTHTAQTWELASAYAVVISASAFFRPASTGLVAEIVPAGRLQKANSLLSISNSASSIVAPAISGLLVATIGPGWAFVADAASFAGSALFLAALAPPGFTKPQRRPFLADLAAGWRAVSSRTWAWATLMGNTAGNLAFAVFVVLGPVLAVRRLGGASGWGLVASGMAVGALLGGLLAMWLKARRPVASGMRAAALGAVPVLALAASLPLPVVVVSAAAGDAGGIFLNANWETVIQRLIPNELLSRFRSFDYLLAYAAVPVGYGIAGPLTSAVGANATLTGCAVFIVVSAVLPTLLPAVRGIVRRDDGTITGDTALARASSRTQEAS